MNPTGCVNVYNILNELPTGSKPFLELIGVHLHHGLESGNCGATHSFVVDIFRRQMTGFKRLRGKGSGPWEMMQKQFFKWEGIDEPIELFMGQQLHVGTVLPNFVQDFVRRSPGKKPSGIC